MHKILSKKHASILTMQQFFLSIGQTTVELKNNMT